MNSEGHCKDVEVFRLLNARVRCRVVEAAEGQGVNVSKVVVSLAASFIVRLPHVPLGRVVVWSCRVRRTCVSSFFNLYRPFITLHRLVGMYRRKLGEFLSC